MIIIMMQLLKVKTSIEGIENKQRLQTLSIDNAWSNNKFPVLLDVSYATTYIFGSERL